MLAAATLALGLTTVSPVPLPRPVLAHDVQTPVTGSQHSPSDGKPPPPRDLSDKTILEIILQDLDAIGADNNAPSEPAKDDAQKPDTAPSPAGRDVVALAAEPLNVPIPPARPVVLAPREPSENRPGSGSGVCGDLRLSGTMIASVRGKNSACGISAPVRLTAVNGIKLTTPATLRCDAARTFADWLTETADPQARRDLGASISNVWVMASYSCRTRNHRKGARLSEHSFGRAIDIGGFVLANGRKVTVLDNWNKGTPGRFLRSVWKRACGPFKTVLGPESDRFHRNHFHFDVAERRSTFCR